MTIYSPGYSGVVGDPPWPEYGGGKIKRGADRHYRLVKKVEEIAPLIAEQPLWRPNPDACFVWLWCPSWRVAVGQAAMVLLALGARPVRSWIWVKPTMGIGQYGRGRYENLVLGVIGKLKPLPAIRGMPDVLECDGPIGANGKRIHSAKPPEMFERIRLVTPGPLASLFEREPRVGFDSCGHMRGTARVDVSLWNPTSNKHVHVVAKPR